MMSLGYGDLNNILSLFLKMGGIINTTHVHMIRFQNFLNQENLCSLNASGVPFTWTNNHKDSSVIYEEIR